MKTVLYRYQQLSAPEDNGFLYSSMRVTSDTKVTEELCLRNEFGSYIDSHYHEWICEIIKEVEDDVLVGRDWNST